jgi:type IX secretion system PorP/SprF family membrane protein
MKKITTLFLFMLGAVAVQAQQLPLYSSYFFTPYFFNPATAGAKGFAELTAVHRRQWAGVEGGPQTSAIGFNGASSSQKVGYAIYAFNDVTDIISRWGFYGTYAYHVKLSDKNKLSFGLSGGYLANSINTSGIRVPNQTDPVLFTSAATRGVFDLNAGINLTVGQFQIGAAVPQLLGSAIEYRGDFAGTVEYQLIRHYVFNTQYDLQLQKDKMVLSPFVVVRAADGVPVQVDAGAMFNMVKYGYVGAAFRSDYAVTGNLGVHLSDQITIGYAQDFSLSKFSSSLGASNEIFLTWRFGSNDKIDKLENEIKRMKRSQQTQAEEVEQLINDRLSEFEAEMQSKAAQEAKPAEATTPNGGGNGQAGAGAGAAGAAGVAGAVGGAIGESGKPQPGQVNEGMKTAAPIPVNQGTVNESNASKGYYLVPGVFSTEENARSFIQRLNKMGFTAQYFKDSENNMYYVYLDQYDNYQRAKEAKTSRYGGAYLGDLWIKVVD